jgi:hypothetical protein
MPAERKAPEVQRRITEGPLKHHAFLTLASGWAMAERAGVGSSE